MSETAPTAPAPPGRLSAWARRHRLWRRLPIVLAAAALLSGLATYAALTGWVALGPDPRTVVVLLNIDVVLVLLLSAVVLRRLVQIWLERRRGSAGSRLHTRITVLFGVAAIGPAIVVAVFSLLFLQLGLQSWFSERVGTAIEESVKVAEAYLEEHRQIIRADALAMANDINRSGPALVDNPAVFNRFLATQAALRSLTEVMVFTRDGRILGRTGLTFSLLFGPVPVQAMEKADAGEAVILTSDSDDRVRALVKLAGFVDAYLFVGRFVDSRVIGHMTRVQGAAAEYKRLEGQRSGIQITFVVIFGVVTLLLLLASVWIGLTFATRLVRPIVALVAAAERVRSGDLSVRVEEGPGDDELTGLSRAFNRMTDQLESQRRELVEANRQLDARRRFTESVLLGVSAGVIGLDAQGRVELANRSALDLLDVRADALIGLQLGEVVPEMASLIENAMARLGRRAQDQISVTRAGRTLELMVRIGAERLGGALEGFVVTFDDITPLVTAQRKAAWADVARRIAHEIKNPLTPIQLSAERIKHKYLKEIRSDPEVFTACTDTIVRQVRDIGRMIDEFSAFARMPAPVFRREAVSSLVGEALDLHRVARPDVTFAVEAPDRALVVNCDGRQMTQVLNNLIQNAIDAIDEREPPAEGALEPGRVGIAIDVDDADGMLVIEVRDNGRGLPEGPTHRLWEPYITTRVKGTGLGLAIVRKIVEDHGGEIELRDAAGGGAVVRIRLPEADTGSATAAMG